MQPILALALGPQVAALRSKFSAVCDSTSSTIGKEVIGLALNPCGGARLTRLRTWNARRCRALLQAAANAFRGAYELLGLPCTHSLPCSAPSPPFALLSANHRPPFARAHVRTMSTHAQTHARTHICTHAHRHGRAMLLRTTIGDRRTFLTAFKDDVAERLLLR